ncbi:putative DnaJ domain, tetratricopeptide-like helical domain superfamily [Helianthus debilis subsp. tardiflorus]
MVDHCFLSTTTMVASPSHGCVEKKYWWLTNKKIVDKYVKDARALISSPEQSDIASALNLVDAALALSPRYEQALELKARSLLYLRRYKEVADMLQDYIPSLKMSSDDSTTSSSSSSSVSSDGNSQPLSRERVNLLSSGDNAEPSFKCFSVSDLKKKVRAGLGKNCDKEGQWRYLVLGEACCHLGLMEDAMVLLQTGKRLASAAFRRESICWSDDSFSFSADIITDGNQPQTPPRTESESVCHLLGHIKLLVRRKTAAIAALEAGLYTEAIRHFSKIVDGKRGAPQGFLAECYLHRASAYHQELKQRIASGETGNVDYHALIGLRRGCSRSELERAHLLLALRHKPDKSITFIDRCELTGEVDVDSIRERAKMSGILLYRLIQRGYTNVLRMIQEDEVAEKERKKASAALQQEMQLQHQEPVKTVNKMDDQDCENKKAASVYQGVFCRDLAVVGNLLSQARFNRPIPMKYEALSC